MNISDILKSLTPDKHTVLAATKGAIQLLKGDQHADQVVPPSGHTATLTSFTAGAMAFLAVFALALSLATGRLADRWKTELSQSATVRISAPEDQISRQVSKLIEVLNTTPGIAAVNVLSEADQKALLEPWFGPDIPLDDLPIPKLIDIIQDGNGFDADGLRLRLSAEVPGAVLDDHSRWRKPLVRAAGSLRWLGTLSILLIALATAAMITLAANAALATNAQVIKVLRLVGARDDYIAQAFVRRFTLRAFSGAAVGTLAGVIAVMLLPDASAASGFLTGLGFVGWQWIWPMFIPPLAAIVAYVATRFAAFKRLGELT